MLARGILLPRVSMLASHRKLRRAALEASWPRTRPSRLVRVTSWQPACTWGLIDGNGRISTDPRFPLFVRLLSLLEQRYREVMIVASTGDYGRRLIAARPSAEAVLLTPWQHPPKSFYMVP